MWTDTYGKHYGERDPENGFNLIFWEMALRPMI